MHAALALALLLPPSRAADPADAPPEAASPPEDTLFLPPISEEEAAAALEAVLPGARRCLPAQGAFGRIDVRVTLGADGRARRVEVLDARGVSEGVAACVRPLLAEARFPRDPALDGFSFDYVVGIAVPGRPR